MKGLPREFEKAYGELERAYNKSVDKIDLQIGELKGELEDIKEENAKQVKLLEEEARERKEQVFKDTFKGIEEREEQIRKANLSLLEPLKQDGDFFEKFFGFAEALRDRNKIVKTVEEEIRDLEKQAVKELQSIDQGLKDARKRAKETEDRIAKSIEDAETRKLELEETHNTKMRNLLSNFSDKYTKAYEKLTDYQITSQKKLDDLKQALTDAEEEREQFISDIAEDRATILQEFNETSKEIYAAIDEANTTLLRAAADAEETRTKERKAAEEANEKAREAFENSLKDTVGKFGEKIDAERSKLENINTTLAQLKTDYDENERRAQEDRTDFLQDLQDIRDQFVKDADEEAEKIKQQGIEGLIEAGLKAAAIAGLVAFGVPAPIAAPLASIAVDIFEILGVVKAFAVPIEAMGQWFGAAKDTDENALRQAEKDAELREPEQFDSDHMSVPMDEGIPIDLDGSLLNMHEGIDRFTHTLDPLNETLVAFTGDMSTLGIDLRDTGVDFKRNVKDGYRRGANYLNAANYLTEFTSREVSKTQLKTNVKTANVWGKGVTKGTNLLNRGLATGTLKFLDGANFGAYQMMSGGSTTKKFLELGGKGASKMFSQGGFQTGNMLITAGTINAKQQIDGGYKGGKIFWQYSCQYGFRNS